ncbi:MAG: radical SAM protein [candidate division WOR-3 bacterium]
MLCNICPHQCLVDRKEKVGICKAPAEFKIARAQLHYYEEPCISGKQGSGTIFFSHCNLHCKFCQNYKISQKYFGKIVTAERLVEIMFELKTRGALNINLVSPTPYTEQLISVLEYVKVKNKLNLPIIWNSNGYEKIETLRNLSGLVDVYLPDLKYFSSALSLKFSGVKDYFKWASSALLEMRRQLPEDIFNKDGIMEKGLILRHLVLPGQIEDSKKVLEWVRRSLGRKTIVSLMAQYYPTYCATDYPPLDRRLTQDEYQEVCDYFLELGFTDGFFQELSSAESSYTPDFNLEGV